MKINDDHMYHGAALTQIAEHPQFTAINSFGLDGEKSRSAFLVNQDIGIYVKYATKRTKPYGEFQFTFSEDHIAEIESIADKAEKTFIVFVCVAAEEICCIRRAELQALLAARRQARGYDEETHTVLVTVPKGKSCRVYMNAPGKRKKTLGEMVVARNRFPNAVFE